VITCGGASGRRASVALLVAAALALTVSRPQAHKPITSPYTYNEDVFPIFRDRCGRCHVTGGVAPMSLMTYKEAYPWGESIRTELIAGHMPPGQTEQPAGWFRNTHALTARELNTLLVWVTGGNPVGNPEHPTPAVTVEKNWPLGTPDEVLTMPSAFTVAADKNEDTKEFTWPVHSESPRWLRAVDLLPGTPSIVRSATIRVKAPADSRSADSRTGEQAAAAPHAVERLLAVWVPGDTPASLEHGAAFELPADAEIVLRVHYKKTWEHERNAMTDQSSVGLYFLSSSGQPLLAMPVAAPTAAADSASTRISFTRTISEDVEAFAVYPEAELTNMHVGLRVERPDGTTVDLIRFRPQLDWRQRYWFEQPIALPHGTRLIVDGSSADTLLPPGASPVPAQRPDPATLRLTLNVLRR
jgi:hypothetical protein